MYEISGIKGTRKELCIPYVTTWLGHWVKVLHPVSGFGQQSFAGVVIETQIICTVVLAHFLVELWLGNVTWFGSGDFINYDKLINTLLLIVDLGCIFDLVFIWVEGSCNILCLCKCFWNGGGHLCFSK